MGGKLSLDYVLLLLDRNEWNCESQQAYSLNHFDRFNSNAIEIDTKFKKLECISLRQQVLYST